MRSLSAAAARPPARRGGGLAAAAAALGAVLNVFRFMIAYSPIRGTFTGLYPTQKSARWATKMDKRS